jgi:dTDP-4-amino-4,6-dideoxygalactose transaminase
MEKIQMVDLVGQYLRIKTEIDSALLDAVEAAQYINGPQVKQFEAALAEYIGDTRAVHC